MSDRAPSPAPAPVPAPVPAAQHSPETVITEVQVKEEELTPLPSPTISLAQTDVNPGVPVSSPSRARRTPLQRRALLRDDPQAQEVEPQRVLCRTCQKWIRLSSQSEYGLSNWQAHKQRCRGTSPGPRSVRRTPSKPNFSPGSRVATAERKIVLLNDPQVRACSPGHVQCGTCKSVVALDGEVDYDLAKWTEHKEKCIPMTPAPMTPQCAAPRPPRAFPPPSTSSTHSQVSTGRSPRSPTPMRDNPSSTAETAETSPAPARVGMKRAREEETEGAEWAATDERPTNRARTETYKPPERRASVLGWLLRPLEEFARGFREGLGST